MLDVLECLLFRLLHVAGDAIRLVTHGQSSDSDSAAVSVLVGPLVSDRSSCFIGVIGSLFSSDDSNDYPILFFWVNPGIGSVAASSIPFSTSEPVGQTVTQWPQETQVESSIVSASLWNPIRVS